MLAQAKLPRPPHLVKVGLLAAVHIGVIQTARDTHTVPSVIDQIREPARRHEITITGDIRLGVHPSHGRLHERVQLRLRVVVREPVFRDPDRHPVRYIPGRADVRLEVSCAGVYIAVPVQVHEVKRAAVAGGNELLEPGQAIGCSAVRHGWQTELGFASERLHVLLPGLDGGCDGHAGRTRAFVAEIWLVEGH